jgi:CHASE3 domain sensor protein
MIERKRLGTIATRRGAIVIVILLIAVLVVAIGGTVSAVRTVDKAAQLETSVTAAQEQLDALQQSQLEEENGLRGFIATRQREFLSPYVGATDSFDESLLKLRAALPRAGVNDLDSVVRDIADTHESWTLNFAAVLKRNPNPPDAVALQKSGKLYIDRFRRDTIAVHTRLDNRLTDVREELKASINRTVQTSIVSVVLFALVASIFVGRITIVERRHDRAQGMVDTLQGALRVEWRALPRTQIGTAYVSATDEAEVGGDLFDVWPIDEHRGYVLIADVSGKGIEAAVNTAFVQFAIRALASELTDPAQVVARFNDLFIDAVREPGLFVVLFFGIFDARTMHLTYTSAGHPCAYVRRAGGVESLPPTGPIVGLFHDSAYAAATAVLQLDDVLFLATDGLTESRDATGAFLGEEGVVEMLRTAPREPQALCDLTIGTVRARAGGRITDDLAVLAVRVGRESRPERRSSHALAAAGE